MKKQIKKLVSLTLALTMLLSLAVMPQTTATASAAGDEVLVSADFENTKGGLKGQFQTVVGGVDRVYTDAVHGKSYRIFAQSADDSSLTNRQQQRAFLNLPEAVSTGKLHISYELMTDTNEVDQQNGKLQSLLALEATAQTEALSKSNYKAFVFGNNTGGIKYVKGGTEWGYGDNYVDNVVKNQWYQLDMVIDFDSEEKTVTYWIDGELMGTTPLHPNLTAVQNLTFFVWSLGGITTPSSLYVDNLKITKLGTASEMTVSGTVVGKEKTEITLNLSETMAYAPALSASNISVIKRGNDASEAISSVSAKGRNITINFANALSADTEYQVKIDAELTGINGAQTADICEYVFVKGDAPAANVVLDMDFDDASSTPFATQDTANRGFGNTVDLTVENYPGRGKVNVARTTDSTAAYANGVFSAAYLLDSTLNKNEVYEISYSSMITGAGASGGGVVNYHPRHAFVLSNRSLGFAGYSPTDYSKWNQLSTAVASSRGYMMVMSYAGGITDVAAKHVASYGTGLESGTALLAAAKLKNYSTDTSDSRYIRYNNGEWYETKIILNVGAQTADYYWDGVYVGTQTADDGLNFHTYEKANGAITTDNGIQEPQLLYFNASFAPEVNNDTQRGEFMLDDIKITKLGSDVYAKSIRFADSEGNKAFSTGTVSTLYNKIEITAENAESIADMGTVTLTEDGATKTFTPSFADGVYTMDLGGYMKGSTTYVLSVLGTTYSFTTDAGGFKVEGIELSKNGTVLEDLSGLSANDTVRATVKVINTTGSEKTAWISIAYYNGSKMGDVIFKTLTSDGEETVYSDYVEISVADISNLKIAGFAWDTLGNMKPLIKKEILPAE